MSDQGLTELERTAIEWRCSQLVARFALLNDDSDYENLVALFTEDAVFSRPTMPDKPMVGRETILAQFRQRPARTLRHLMANTVVTAETAERATGTCYMILYAGPPAAPGEPGPPSTDQAPMIGQFKDVFVKVGGQWLFAERRGSLGLTVGS
jgi:hypothetical protein